jgi:hypothetical protein
VRAEYVAGDCTEEKLTAAASSDPVKRDAIH